MKMKRLLKSLLKMKAVVAFLCLFLSGCGSWIDMPDISTEELYNRQKSCWTCEMFVNVFRVFGGESAAGGVEGGREGLITGTFKATFKGAQNLLLLAFAFWLLAKVIKLILSPGEMSGFLSELLKKSLFVIIGYAALSAPDKIHTLAGYIVYPIFGVFIDLAVSVLESGVAGEGGLSCSVSMESWQFTFHFNDFYAPLRCFLELVHSKIGNSMNLAARVMWNKDFGMGAFFIGLFMYAIFWLMDIILALSIIDSIFSIGIIMILMPLFIVAWIFEISRGYTKQAFKTVIGASSQCAVVSIFTAYTVSAFSTFTQETNRAITLGDVEKNVTPLIEQTIAIQESGPGWMALVMCLFTFAGIGKINGLLGNIIGTSSSMFASVFRQMMAIGAVVGYAAAKTALSGGMLAVSAAKDVGKRTIEGTRKIMQSEDDAGNNPGGTP